ncbi:isoprenoid synthase domain-containing protein [Cladochytrium replicatum]|nr:isoprenoid synthase domain-containing protein [Cladochytrium replicatum]
MPSRRHFPLSSWRPIAIRPHSTSSSLPAALSYCRELVRVKDYDGYLCTLFAPEPSRDAFWALRAFNIEIAQIVDSAKDSRAAQLRSRWWLDAVDEVYDNRPRHHPITIALHGTMKKSSMGKQFLKRIIQARDQLSAGAPFNSMKDLETYAENTASSLLYLQLQALGIEDHNADHAASHIGKAQGIVTIIRGIPYLVRERQLYLPTQLTARNGLSSEDLFRGDATTLQKLSDVVFEIATSANDQLLHTGTLQKSMPPGGVPALLNATVIQNYLQRLEKANFNVFHPKLQKRSLSLPFRIFLNHRNKQFMQIQ